MAKWIVSIVSIVLLSSIIFILLPESKLAKYIKIVIGFLVILVVVQPIFSIKTGDLELKNNFIQADIEIQDSFLDYVSSEKIKNIQQNCQIILKENGFNNSKININYFVKDNGEFEILNVTVDLKNSTYNYNLANIDIIEEIISPISKYLDINKEQVNVIE